MIHFQIRTIPALVAMALTFAAGWGIAKWRGAESRAHLQAELNEYRALVEATQEITQKSLDHSVETQAQLTDCMLKLKLQRSLAEGK